MFRHQLLDHSKIINWWSLAVTVLQRKASMQQNAFLLVLAIKGCIYVSTHFLTSQPTLIKLDNENIGGHCYTFTLITGVSSWTRLDTIFFRTVNHNCLIFNYQTSYNDFFEVYITETVTLSPIFKTVNKLQTRSRDPPFSVTPKS